MGKQNEYRFNLKFDETDEDHRRVSEFLNNCGRKKARYVVRAMLTYWSLQEGKLPATDKTEKREAERSKDVLISIGSNSPPLAARSRIYADGLRL